jgi:hypothetical protein
MKLDITELKSDALKYTWTFNILVALWVNIKRFWFELNDVVLRLSKITLNNAFNVEDSGGNFEFF